jgi:hypothetical protein
MTRHYIELAPEKSPLISRGINLRSTAAPLRLEHTASLSWRARWIAASCFISGLAAGLLLALASS